MLQAKKAVSLVPGIFFPARCRLLVELGRPDHEDGLQYDWAHGAAPKHKKQKVISHFWIRVSGFCVYAEKRAFSQDREGAVTLGKPRAQK